MSYFLDESEKKKVKLVSFVDGKDVFAEGTLREVTPAKQKAIYTNLADFFDYQERFKDLDVRRQEAIANLSGGLIDDDAFNEEFERQKSLVDELQDWLPKYYKQTAETIIRFDKEPPSIEFYASDEFEYVYLIRLRDFFLNIQRNLSAQ